MIFSISAPRPQQPVQQQNAVSNPAIVQQQQQQNSVVASTFGPAFSQPARNVAANPNLALGKVKVNYIFIN